MFLTLNNSNNNKNIIQKRDKLSLYKKKLSSDKKYLKYLI